MQQRQYMDLHILPISAFHQKAEKLWKQKATMARDRSFWKNNRSRRRRIRFKIEQQRQRQRQIQGQRQRQKGKRGESVQRSSNLFFRITTWSHHFKRVKMGFLISNFYFKFLRIQFFILYCSQDLLRYVELDLFFSKLELIGSNSSEGISVVKSFDLDFLGRLIPHQNWALAN